MSGKVKTIIIISCLMAVAAILRFWEIGSLYHFAGDEARDLLLIRGMFEGGSIPLLGPSASVAPFSLGPFFYYLLAVPYWIGGFTPVAGCVFTGLLAVAAIGLVYHFGERFLGKYVGLFAGAVMAVSFAFTWFSRWPWNPNVLPFFMALFFLACMYSTRAKKIIHQNIWWLVMGFALGACLQLHSSCFLLLPFVLIWILFVGKPRRKTLWGFMSGLGVLIVMFIPMLIFDLRNNFANSRGMVGFVLHGTENTKTLIERFTWNAHEYYRFFSFALFGQEILWPMLLIVVPAVVILVLMIRRQIVKKDKDQGFVLLGIFGLIFYFGYLAFSGVLYFHYFSPVYVWLSLLLGLLLATIYKYNIYGKILAVATMAVLASLNIWQLAIYLDDLKIGAGSNFGVSGEAMTEAMEYVKNDGGDDFVFKYAAPLGDDSRAYLYMADPDRARDYSYMEIPEFCDNSADSLYVVSRRFEYMSDKDMACFEKVSERDFEGVVVEKYQK